MLRDGPPLHSFLRPFSTTEQNGPPETRRGGGTPWSPSASLCGKLTLQGLRLERGVCWEHREYAGLNDAQNTCPHPDPPEPQKMALFEKRSLLVPLSQGYRCVYGSYEIPKDFAVRSSWSPGWPPVKREDMGRSRRRCRLSREPPGLWEAGGTLP